MLSFFNRCIFSSPNIDVVYFFASPSKLLFIANFLKFSFLYSSVYFIDSSAVDYFNRFNRFQLFYLFKSSNFNKTIFLVTNLNSNLPVSMSLSKIFPASGWSERETHDMYGIYFTNHFDLRRLLTDYGFEGFPLRKDFPLVGYTQVRYDDSTRRIVVEPVEFSQEYRKFDFKSPWNF
jgi:NADH:ubiquinone oxidoreductase subunit C